jgi:hypothetical protein
MRKAEIRNHAETILKPMRNHTETITETIERNHRNHPPIEAERGFAPRALAAQHSAPRLRSRLRLRSPGAPATLQPEQPITPQINTRHLNAPSPDAVTCVTHRWPDCARTRSPPRRIFPPTEILAACRSSTEHEICHHMVAIEKCANMAYIFRRLVTFPGFWQRSGNRNATNRARKPRRYQCQPATPA